MEELRSCFALSGDVLLLEHLRTLHEELQQRFLRESSAGTAPKWDDVNREHS